MNSPRSFLAALAAALILVLAALLTSPAHAAKANIHRFAFVMSANSGGVGRVPLRYANKDAATFGQLLKDLGGITEGDVVLVPSANRALVQAGVEKLRRKLQESAQNGERVEVMLYYSGHANEAGLLIGGDTLTYREFKAMVIGLPADVRVMIIDSCESGLLIASKGGQRRPAFLMDVSSKTQGNAIITSASSDEAAQESANIAGSFFTYYLMSGLRGAADLNGDGKITLNEAYYYAYAETLARTEKTRHGAQHPSYDFQLAGTGDLVLTDLRQSTATLTFAAPARGRYFVRSKLDQLVAEINKPAGRGMELALEPAAYVILREQDKTFAEARFSLDAHGRLAVESLPFRSVAGESNQARGDGDRNFVDTGVDKVVDSFEDFSSYLSTNSKDLELAYDEMSFMHLGLKLRSGRFYTLVDIAYRSGYGGSDTTFGLGIGTVVERSDWLLDFRAYGTYLAGSPLLRLQGTYGKHFTDRLSWFAGPSLMFTRADKRIYDVAEPRFNFGVLTNDGAGGKWAWIGAEIGLKYVML